MPPSATSAGVSIAVPHGLDQIIAVFGDIFAYLGHDGSLDRRWEAEQLVTTNLPFPMPLSWDHMRLVNRPSKTDGVEALYSFVGHMHRSESGNEHPGDFRPDEP